jgi:hypothetical protein
MEVLKEKIYLGNYFKRKDIKVMREEKLMISKLRRCKIK